MKGRQSTSYAHHIVASQSRSLGAVGNKDLCPNIISTSMIPKNHIINNHTPPSLLNSQNLYLNKAYLVDLRGSFIIIGGVNKKIAILYILILNYVTS